MSYRSVIRILRSIPLDFGSWYGSGSGSCSFLQWLSLCQKKWVTVQKVFLLITCWLAHLYVTPTDPTAPDLENWGEWDLMREAGGFLNNTIVWRPFGLDFLCTLFITFNSASSAGILRNSLHSFVGCRIEPRTVALAALRSIDSARSLGFLEPNTQCRLSLRILWYKNTYRNYFGTVAHIGLWYMDGLDHTVHVLKYVPYTVLRGASKIKVKNVNKKRMATARRLIFFWNFSRHPLLIWLHCFFHDCKTLKAVGTATAAIVLLTPANFYYFRRPKFNFQPLWDLWLKTCRNKNCC